MEDMGKMMKCPLGMKLDVDFDTNPHWQELFQDMRDPLKEIKGFGLEVIELSIKISPEFEKDKIFRLASA